MLVICHRCGGQEHTTETIHYGSGSHIGAWCAGCGSWIKWLKQSDYQRVATERREGHTTVSWDSYTREAEKSTGDWPEIPDDLYDAMVQDVSEPETEANKFKKKDTDPDEVTRFYITWELTSGDVPEGTTIRQYVTLPEKYLDEGFLSEKSWLYKIMVALGFDMTTRFKVDPPSWQGMTARLTIKNPPAGEEGRPKITEMMPARRARPAPAQKRQPVGAAAGRGSLRERLEGEEDDDLPYE